MPNRIFKGMKKPDLFCKSCVQVGLPMPEKEVQFVPDRKWAVDYLFQTEFATIALEVEGWGHRTKERFNQDIEKYNTLAEMGILLIRTKPKELMTFEHTYNPVARALANAETRFNEANGLQYVSGRQWAVDKI